MLLQGKKTCLYFLCLFRFFVLMRVRALICSSSRNRVERSDLDTNETKKKKQFSFLQMKIPSARVRPFSFTPDYPLPSFTYDQRNPWLVTHLCGCVRADESWVSHVNVWLTDHVTCCLSSVKCACSVGPLNAEVNTHIRWLSNYIEVNGSRGAWV